MTMSGTSSVLSSVLAYRQASLASTQVDDTSQPMTVEEASAMSAGSAWNGAWEQRFGQLLHLMGLSDTDVRMQLASVEDQPLTEQQLQVAYDQMRQSLGDYDEQWQARLQTALAQVPGTDEQRMQALQQIASSGLDDAALQRQYEAIVAAHPAWNDAWRDKFGALELPDALVTQLAQSDAPASVLQQQYDKLAATKQQFVGDGRYERLTDADATSEERWSVMLQGTQGEDFDKVVEQIHSAHVPVWKRIGSFALNLVPGVYALEYLTGRDWLTGDNIGRTNPLNILGAVASGFAGFTAVRGAIAGVQGLVAANAAAQASKVAAGGAALVDAVSGTSALSQGAFKAIQAAGLVDKFDKGLRFADYLKSAVPIVNRFGEAGRLAAVGRGYFQGMQLAAGTAALKTLADGSTVVDKATKAAVFDGLKQGQSIQEALAAAGRGTIVDGVFTGSRAGGFAVDAASVVRDTSRYGFLQGAAGKAAEGNRILRGSGNFTFNPFKNTATISQTATDGVYSLGRGVNFASRGGLAQGIGLVRGANSVSSPGLAAQAAARASSANEYVRSSAGQRVAGLAITDDAQRVETMAKTAEWAKKLGVGDQGITRSLLQVGGSNRAASRIATMVEDGGSTGYHVTRTLAHLGTRYGGYVAPGLVGGATVGLTGRQLQPAWEYFKHRDEIEAEERERTEQADREADRLREIYAQRHAQ